MKKQGFNTAKTLIAAACAVSMLTLGACSSDSSSRASTPTTGPVVPPPPPPPPPPVNLTAAVTLTVIDVETGAPMLDSVTVVATGPDALLITDANSQRSPWTIPAGGTIVLVAQGVGPIDATLTATSTNYFDSSTTVSFTENAFITRSVRLTPKAFTSSTSIQTATATATTLGTTGLLMSTMTAATTPTTDPAAAGTSTSVKVKSGTIMRDSSGAPVTGNVSMNVGFFPNDANSAAPLGKSPLNNFPGGLSNIQIANPGAGGTQSGGTFISGGLIAVEIGSDTGQTVSTFDTPIEIASTMSTDTVNPETGAKIKTGDTIPVWSYNEGTGQWTYESTATIGAVDTASKTANVTFEANHLSYWNLDYFADPGVCSTTTFSVVDGTGKTVGDDWLGLEVTRQGGGYVHDTDGALTNSSVQLDNPPAFNVALKFYELSTSQVLYTAFNVDLCAINGSTITIGATPPPVATVTADPTLSCDYGNAPTTAIPAGVELYQGTYPGASSADYTYKQTQYLNIGADASYDLEAGKTYTFSAFVTSDVTAENNDGSVITAYTDRVNSTFVATDGATQNLNFQINCFSATGATGGTGGGL